MKNKRGRRKQKSPEEIELERQPHKLRAPGVTELDLTPYIESISHVQYDEEQKDD